MVIKHHRDAIIRPDMDLNQRKLTRDEWNSIEVPISADEQAITKLIQEGYDNVTISQNNTLSLLRYLKIPFNEAIDAYVFCQYLEKEVSALAKLWRWTTSVPGMY